MWVFRDPSFRISGGSINIRLAFVVFGVSKGPYRCYLLQGRRFSSQIMAVSISSSASMTFQSLLLQAPVFKIALPEAEAQRRHRAMLTLRRRLMQDEEDFVTPRIRM